jgi:hypothetical protein
MCAGAMFGEDPAQPAATGVFRATRTSIAPAADRRAAAVLSHRFYNKKMRNIFVFGAVNRQRLPHDQQAGDGRFAVFPPETWKGGVR